MIELSNSELQNSVIPVTTVIGIGGGGNNAVNRMIEAGMKNVNFIAMNTDYQVLDDCLASDKLQLGKKMTSGLGAGGDPSVGEASAEESAEDIAAVVKNSQMVILTCGLGGGTGTGAAPVVARICHEQKVLTVAVVTLPFGFEGLAKQDLAQNALEKLHDNTDMLLVIPNDRLLSISDKDLYLDEAFTMADSVLKYTIEGISGIIFGKGKGTVNLDFNDLKSTLTNAGFGYLGIGIVKEDDSIIDAVKQAINSPLLESDIGTASKILINTSGRIKLKELDEAVSYLHEITKPDVKILWGTVPYQDSEGNIVVTVIATGLEGKKTAVKNEAPAINTSYRAPVRDDRRSDLQIPMFLTRTAKDFKN